jgi:hypothetical protein
MTVTRTFIAALLCLALIAGGCSKSRTNRTRGQRDDLQQTASERVSNLQASVGELQRTVSQMPADDPNKDRRLTSRALAQTATALAAIEGPRPSGAYRQQVRIIETSRTQLERSSPNVPSEPAVDSALRAAYNALVSLREGRFAGNQSVAQLVSEVGQKIPQLDSNRGSLHSIVVSDIMGSVTRTLKVMTDVIEKRLPPAQTRPTASTPPAAPQELM